MKVVGRFWSMLLLLRTSAAASTARNLVTRKLQRRRSRKTSPTFLRAGESKTLNYPDDHHFGKKLQALDEEVFNLVVQRLQRSSIFAGVADQRADFFEFVDYENGDFRIKADLGCCILKLRHRVGRQGLFRRQLTLLYHFPSNTQHLKMSELI